MKFISESSPDLYQNPPYVKTNQPIAIHTEQNTQNRVLLLANTYHTHVRIMPQASPHKSF